MEGLEDAKVASREDPEGDELLQQTLEAHAIVAGIKAVGELGYKDGWKTIKVSSTTTTTTWRSR